MKPTEYFLTAFGIDRLIQAFRSVTPLLCAQNIPIVFLIDENHTIDECIEQNIKNAHALIGEANVTPIGVESHRGGMIWNDYECKYTDKFDIGADLEPARSQLMCAFARLRIRINYVLF